MIPLSLGFGLGVLAVVFADAVERLRRAKRSVVVVYADAFANSSSRAREQRAREIVDSLAQDSTIK